MLTSKYAESNSMTSTGFCSTFLGRLVRRKLIDSSEATSLDRCLSTLDLTALGIGSTLGAGIYVVAGEVARKIAGPAVIFSFLVAALASVMAGLCYAEFGARVPKTGSAYIYSYVTVGELWAFIIGWNLVLEYVIGTASVARAWSSYFDSIIGYKIQPAFKSCCSFNLDGLSDHADFFALAIIIIMTGLLCVGVKESSRFNNVFTGINLTVVLYVIISGMFKADINNWKISPSDVPNATNADNGDGGFFPFGLSGVMSGAATCFYAFIGFDVIATTGEEAKNPQKAIPISIIISLLGCFLAYFGISAIITLMAPYYTIDTNAPLPVIFDSFGWSVAKYIISVGAVCALTTSLLGSMFPMPRIVYAMGKDGVIFRFLSNVNKRLKTPLIATIISGTLAGAMATIFDLSALVDMMSIGTLLAYTLVAACVLILRYKPKQTQRESKNNDIDESNNELTELKVDDIEMGEPTNGEKLPNEVLSTDVIIDKYAARTYKWREILQQLLRPENRDRSTELSSKVATWCIGIMVIVILLLDVMLAHFTSYLGEAKWWAILLVAILVLLILIINVLLFRQPDNTEGLHFKVPLVPILPSVSICVNLFLMMKLSLETWIRFGVWMFLGFIIYFGYLMWNIYKGQDFLNEDRPRAQNSSIR